MTKNISLSIRTILPVAGIMCTVILSLSSMRLSGSGTAYPGSREVVVHQRSGEQEAAPRFLESFVSRELPGTTAHVSSVTLLADGTLACVWYQGSREGARDVSIYISYLRNEASTWSEPSILLTREQSSQELKRYVKKLGNAMIFADSRGRLWLFYASVFAGGWSGTSLNYKMSSDSGKTWSPSEKMVLSPFFNLTNNLKNKAIELDDGSFLLPVYHELLSKYSQLIHFIPGSEYNRYEIWKVTTERKAIQPTLLYDGNGEVTALFRNMGNEKDRHILHSISTDLGKTWSALSETPLPNPNSGFDMIRLDDGSYLGVINDSFSNRNNLTLVLSSDRGKTWRRVKVLEDKEGAEYSYPSIIRDGNGTCHVTYTYDRRKIKHVMFNEEWLKRNI